MKGSKELYSHTVVDKNPVRSFIFQIHISEYHKTASVHVQNKNEKVNAFGA
jgi:hypothetical protein